MAAPQILQVTVAAAQAVALVGMPEARIILAEATIAVATAPKSNASYNAINQALADVDAGKIGAVPLYLRNAPTKLMKEWGNHEGYKYAHDGPVPWRHRNICPKSCVAPSTTIPTIAATNTKSASVLPRYPRCLHGGEPNRNEHRGVNCNATITVGKGRQTPWRPSHFVDDDQAIGEMLSLVLENEGFQTVTCLDGLRAVEIFPIVKPDLILLDVMLPGLDGTGVARRIRATSNVPIIMLTAKSDTLDVAAGLEAGADDYVPKPFKVAELLARIHARFRIAKPAAEDGATGGASGGNATVNHLERVFIVIDRLEHTATKDGKDLNLTPWNSSCCSCLRPPPARPSVVPACSRMSGDTRIPAIRACQCARSTP